MYDAEEAADVHATALELPTHTLGVAAPPVGRIALLLTATGRATPGLGVEHILGVLFDRA